MQPPRIVVVGSTNTDLVVAVERLPAAGETVVGGEMQTVAGGKGANQAVAAARLGGAVAFISRVGADDFGRQALAKLTREGIDVRFVLPTSGAPSGVALIAVVEGSGENSIVVAPGANARLSDADVTAAAEVFGGAGAVVVSLEIREAAVSAAVSLSASLAIPVILNPAPARRLPLELLAKVDVLTPNQNELNLLGGASALLAAGVKAVVCTNGAAGATIITTQGTETIPAPVVKAVDAVAAGDCFTGALAVELARGNSLRNAVEFAVWAAALKVTRHGAQPGLPRMEDVVLFRERGKA